MNFSPLRERAIGREPEYVSVCFECDEQLDTDEHPRFVDTESRDWNQTHDHFAQSGDEPDKRPA